MAYYIPEEYFSVFFFKVHISMNNSCKVELINLHVLTKQFSPFVVGSCAIKSRDMKKTTKKKKPQQNILWQPY